MHRNRIGVGAPVEAPTTVAANDCITTLKQRLANWTDWDLAEYELGALLGMFPPWANDWSDTKWLIWSNNPAGNLLCELLRSLVRVGFLELDEEENKYRYNEHFAFQEGRS